MRWLVSSLALLFSGLLALVTISYAPPEYHTSASQNKTGEISFAVMGDMPYDLLQQTVFEKFINVISQRNDLVWSMHLGDILGGRTSCSDKYLMWVRDTFNSYQGAFIYTPGDNEWSDCHQRKIPLNPLERKEFLIQTFFPTPGLTLGQRPLQVSTQYNPKNGANPGMIENLYWTATLIRRSMIAFATLHVVGSNNSLELWSNGFEEKFKDQKNKEFEQREKANLEWIDRIFYGAHTQMAKAVVIAMQADMWNDKKTTAQLSGYSKIIKHLATHALTFGKPVLILQGDSHNYKLDKPLENGDPKHKIETPVPNLWRMIVSGGGYRIPIFEYTVVTVRPNHKKPFMFKRHSPALFQYLYASKSEDAN